MGQVNQVEAASGISKKSAVLVKGQTLTLKITGTSQKPKWSSSKTSVATVSSAGKVTAKGKGMATVTAKIGSKKYTCKITVETPSISKSAVLLKAGSSVTLKLNGTSQKVTWKSSDSSIATVSSSGTVTGKKRELQPLVQAFLEKIYL